jgi:hypothetical protein
MRKRTAALFAIVTLLTACTALVSPRAGGQQPKSPTPPSLEPVLGKGADAWMVKAGDFSTGRDTGLSRPVVTVGKTQVVLQTKAAEGGARRLRAVVRLRTDVSPSAAADFYVARKDDKQTGLRLLLSTSRGAESVTAQAQQDGKALHDAAALAKRLDWAPDPSNSFTFFPRAYSLRHVLPGWPEDFRVRIEHDMASLPDVNDKWLEVRIEVRPGEVRFWLDDRLVVIKTGPDVRADGFTHVTLSPGVQLASCEVKPWPDTPGFVPLRMEGYANARSFLDTAAIKPGTLPSAEPSLVGGIPFVFPAVNSEGKDHIDVGRSLYRQANLEGYMPSSEHRWIGSTRRDPARIQLRVPNRSYDALYLVAASDNKADSLPLVSAMFFRPSAGFAETFEARVPLATARSTDAVPLPITLEDGKTANLWLVKVPLDPARLASFADLDVVEIELTKKVHQFRSYPDPFIYGWHQGGPPSAVHVYAATLHEAPVRFDLAADRFGHVWTAPAVPAYTATLTNSSAADWKGKLTLSTRSYDGTETTSQEKPVSLARGGTQQVKFAVPVKRNGYHDLTATLELTGGRAGPSSLRAGPAPSSEPVRWTEKRSFVRLAPDTRSPRWEGKGGLFGYWSYSGGHHTPKAEHHVRLMTEAGARTSIGVPLKDNPLIKKHWGRVSAGAWEVAPQAWARKAPPDPKACADYQKKIVEDFKKAREAISPEHRPDHVYFFPEPHVSTRLTEGNYPTYWQAPEYVLTAEEKENLRVFFVTARCAAEAIRKAFPELKVLIPWGDALFVVPLLRAGFPKDLIDGSGIDTPGFERLPEMQLHQISVHRLYELRKEFAKAGLPEPRLQYCEGIFVPTEVGAVSWREQMDIYNRWTLISMAYGVKRFYSGWFAFDCGNYYGSEHYGGCGIQRRIPYCDPKPAYAAYATMTDRLDQADFDGWLKTGSLTTYCLRFKGPKGKVYTLWNIRGKRPVTLTLAADGKVQVTDAMNNTRTIETKDRQATIITDPSVLYVSSSSDVTSVAAGETDHFDAMPTKGAKQVADLGDGSWTYNSQRDPLYENGTFALMRYPGKFSGKVEADPKHGPVLRSTLLKQETKHELMPWYNVLVPKKPVVLEGAPAALGLWVKGASDWGRVIYVLRDAKGERWTSIGTQDQYNCDDVHSWSAFNFDGWRYLHFELPGHTGYDSFRKHGTTWWRSDGGDGVVDLPLTVERLIVEQRSHVLYVNDVQPAASDSVCLGKMFVEYADPADAMPEAVRLSRLRMPLPAGVPDLPNPIAQMQREGVGAATTIAKLEPPLERNDGTLIHVHFKDVPGAKQYHVWVSAHADGRGAVDMTPGGAKSGDLVRGLRPALKLYFWVSYLDGTGKPSKPSAPASATLVDAFKEK